MSKKPKKLQIKKKANGFWDGDFVSPFADKELVREEVNRRTAKAGYTTKYGEPIGSTKIMVQGFGEGRVKPNIWPRDENGNLIE